MADGVVTIDLKFPANGSEFQSDVVKVEEILKKIGSDTGEQAAASFNKQANKLKSSAEEASGQVSKSIDNAGKKAGDEMQTNFGTNAKAVVKSASATAESVANTTTSMGKGAGDQMQTRFSSNARGVRGESSTMADGVSRDTQKMGKGAGDEMAASARENIGKVKQSFGSLGDYIKGSFIGTTLTQATEKVTAFFTDMVSQATESFDALKSYQSTMKFAGFDTSEIKKGEEELKEYSKETIYNVGEMSNTAATLAANGVKNYTGVTKALGNLVAVAGGSADDMQAASLALTQMVGAGKMYTGDWNQFINGIPGASGKLKKALKDAGAYTGDFKDAMSKGKISAQDMINAIEKLGNTKIAKKAATDTSKFSVAWQGAQESVQDGVLALMDSLGTSGFTGAISAAGDSAYNALSGIGSWITKNKDKISTLGDKLSYITDDLKEIAGSIGQGFIDFFKDAYKWINKTVKKTSDGNDALDSLGLALDKVADHKDTLNAIGKGLGAITTALLAMKAIKGVTTIVVTALKPIVEIIGTIMGIPGGPIILAIAAIGTAFALAYKNIKPFRDFINGLGKKAKSAFAPVASAAKTAFGKISKELSPIVKEFKKTWSQLGKFMSALWDDIVKVVSKAIKKMAPLLEAIGVVVKSVMTVIRIAVTAQMKAVQTIWSTAWKIILNNLKTVWGLIKAAITTSLKVIRDILKVGTDILKGNWKAAWKDVKKVFSDAWDGMKSMVRTAWKGIKGFVADGVNGVIDLINGMITAINKVWTFFGGKGGIGKLGHVHFSTGGQLGSDGSVLAIVNDDGSPDPRELIQRKDGTLQMYQERDAKTIINPGDKVYNSKQTKEIFDSVGVHYAKGNVAGNIWNGVKSFFGGVADKLKDAIEWLKHPLRNTTKLIKSATDSFMSILPDNFKNLAGSMIGKMTGMISDKLKKLIQDYKDENEESDISGAHGTYNPALIRKAAAAMHVHPSDAFIKALQAVIQSESGGRNVVQQIHDSNSGGNEAAGILQYTPGTFAAFAMPGHHNRMNPYDELLAFFNNSDWPNSIGWTTIWGVRKMDWLHSGPQGHRRYGNGGVIDREQMALIGEGNKTEFVVPNPGVAGPARTYEMIGRAAAYASQATGGNGSMMSSNALNLVERKLDALIDYSATQLAELKKPSRSYVLQSDIYKGYNNQQKINDMLGMFVR